MIKKLSLMLTMLLSLVLSTTLVSAQDPGEVIDPTNSEGFVSAYSRAYTPEFDFSSSPEAGIDVSAMMQGVTLVGITFESADNAEAYLENLKTSVEDMQDSGEEGVTMEISEADYGDRAYTLTVELSMSDFEMGTSMTAIQVDDVVFFTQAFSDTTEQAQTLSEPFIDYLMDNEASDDEVVLNEDGTSTGGVFDAFPTAEDTDVIGDLTNIMDMDMSNTSTPEM